VFALLNICIKFINWMSNPEVSSPISPRTMYCYDRQTNIPWNLTQYRVPALHSDYRQITRERQYTSQKKGVKTNDFYVTKRGFYMDYELKVAEGVPSSGNSYLRQLLTSSNTHGMILSGSWKGIC
jgi:hypothetical protein